MFPDDAVRRPKSLVKSKSGELDGADEKMLTDDEKKEALNSEITITDLKNEKQNGDAKLNIGKENFSLIFLLSKGL